MAFVLMFNDLMGRVARPGDVSRLVVTEISVWRPGYFLAPLSICVTYISGPFRCPTFHIRVLYDLSVRLNR